jgi:hypothetical protein
MHFDAVERFAWLENNCVATRDLEAASVRSTTQSSAKCQERRARCSAFTTQHVGHFDELPARVVNDLAPVRHRIGKSLVT